MKRRLGIKMMEIKNNGHLAHETIIFLELEINKRLVILHFLSRIKILNYIFIFQVMLYLISVAIVFKNFFALDYQKYILLWSDFLLVVYNVVLSDD